MGKRISQLNALSSASLNTTLVGIDNGVTYKITLDVLEDAVIHMLSASTDARLDFLETFSSSFNSFSASLDSRLDNVVIDTSSLATKTSLNTFTQSYQTDSASFDSRISSHITGTNYISESYNEFVTSYHAESSSFSNRIEAATNEQFIAGLLLTSSYQTDSASFIDRINQHISGTNYISESLTEFITSYHSESSSFSNRIEAATNEQFIAGLLLTSSFNLYTASINTLSTSVDSRLDILETFSTSADTRIANLENAPVPTYISSGPTAPGTSVVANTTYVGINFSGVPDFQFNSNGTITFPDTTIQSTAFLGIPTGSISSSIQLTELNQFTQSIDSRVDGLEAATASYLTSLNGAISSSAQILSGSGIVSGATQITAMGYAKLVGGNTFYSEQTFTNKVNFQNTLSASVIDSLNTISASYLTFTQSYYSDSASFNSRIISGSAVAGTISSSAQITALGFISTSVSLTSLNTISSSYLTFTQSYYTDSSSFSSRINNITASVNINTGSFVTTSSFNAFTASAQMVTTGSNAFNGTQTITGSLIITSGSFIGSQIVANTSSLYLTSGSNMYVQNNGVVEITGSLIVSGSATMNVVSLLIGTGSGDEGGEINFAIPQTNTTLSTRVITDIWQNRFRIFDGNTNGVFIDLSKAPTGVSGELTWKASGIVNAGTFVQLDNIKATIPSSGNRALALVTTSGTISGYISAHYQGISGGSAGIAQSISLSTSTNTSIFGWNFGQQGDTSHYILRDDTNNRVYRFVVIIGGSYNNNFISIERLH